MMQQSQFMVNEMAYLKHNIFLNITSHTFVDNESSSTQCFL